jgi:hypothetical protein
MDLFGQIGIMGAVILVGAMAGLIGMVKQISDDVQAIFIIINIL